MTIQRQEREITPGELKTLKSALTDQRPLPLPPESSDGAVAELHEMLLELRDFAAALSEGDLSRILGYTGFMAGSLKSLQATLRRLSLQTQQVSQIGSAQQISSNDDFEESFSSLPKS